MIKYVCDRCGAETHECDVRRIRISGLSRYDECTEPYELCSQCADELETWIEEGDKED